MRAGSATTGVAAKAAGIVFQGREGMFEPGLANLFEAIVITAHPIEILRNDRMVVFGN